MISCSTRRPNKGLIFCLRLRVSPDRFLRVHMKAVFTPLKIGLMEISRSRFKQYKNPKLKTDINVLGCFVNFLMIFRYIAFLKIVVKFREISNSYDLM